MGGDTGIPEEISSYEKRRGKKQFDGRRGDSHNIFAASQDQPQQSNRKKQSAGRRDDMGNVDYVKDVFDQLNEPTAKYQSAALKQAAKRPEPADLADPYQHYQRPHQQQPDFSANRDAQQKGKPDIHEKAKKDPSFMKNVDNFFG